MRNYYDIIDDIKGGIPVSKKEALYVAQAADAMLYFGLKHIRDISEAVSKGTNALNARIKFAERYANEDIIKSKKLPIEKYLGNNVVDELEEGSEQVAAAKQRQEDISSAIDAGDVKRVIGLWAKGRI
jgi:hypothetical protein